MCIHVNIKYSLFSKLTATADISNIRESVEVKQQPVITYIGVSNTSSVHYISEGMVEASGSAPSGKQGTGILIID